MRRSSRWGILPIFACLALSVGATSADGQGIVWQEDYARGRAEAVAKGRPLMITIVSATCDRCRKWMDTTLADPAVVAAVAGDFVPVRLEATRSATYVKALGLRSFPITIFAAPDGSIVHAVDGDADAKSMVVQMQVARSKLRKPPVAALPVSRAATPPAPAPLPTGLNGQAGMGYYQPMAPWWNASAFNYPPAWGGYGYQGYAPQQNVGIPVGSSQPLFAPGKRSC